MRRPDPAVSPSVGPLPGACGLPPDAGLGRIRSMRTRRLDLPAARPSRGKRPTRLQASWRALRGALLALVVPLLAGCLTIQPGQLATLTPTTAPSLTPTFAFPTLPPSSTPTPSPAVTPTPDVLANLGDILHQDDFSTNSGWDLRQAEEGSTSLSDGRLTLVVRQPGAFRYVLSPYLPPLDYYLEIRARTELCSPGNEYGVMFRVAANGDHYRVTLTCEGGARVTRVLQGASIALVPVTETFLVLAGAPADNRIGVLVDGDQLRFFLNGLEAFSVRDRALASGGIGLILRATNTGQLTVSFDDLVVRALVPASTAPVASPPP